MSAVSASRSSARQLERVAIIAAIVVLGALSVAALATDGLVGFVDAITFSWASGQIYVDLVIAVAVIAVWLYRDARARGRNPWPWIVGAMLVGMFSPLVYLLVRDRDGAARR